MNQNLWCKLFNLHKFEILRQEEILNPYNNNIVEGIVITSRCRNCGKITYNYIPIKDGKSY